jgi:DNA-binding transcriptional ArsR family regulator
MTGMEEVFRALADASRRELLDRLFDRDGQTLSELTLALPSMSRFGVAKHLRVLEGAGLVVTRRAGRSKLHYLNPVPIRLVHDRWISKYAEPWVRTLSGLKSDLESEVRSTADPGVSGRTVRHVQEIYVRATAERVEEQMRMLRRSIGRAPVGGHVAVEVTPLGSVCRLVVTDAGSPPLTDWAVALSALKTLLETGEPLDVGAA